MIHLTLYSKPGLYKGKMGMILYYLLYARHTENDIYQAKAMDILSDMEPELPALPYCYAEGLAGIGSAFCFLVDNGLIEDVDLDEFLEDFDRIMFSVVYFSEHREISFEKGLIGIGYYYLHRIKTSSGNHPLIPMEHKMVLLSILDILSARFKINGFTYPVNNLPDLSPIEVVDTLLFLEELKNLGICTELVNRLSDHIIKENVPESSTPQLFSTSSRLACQLKTDSPDTILKKIAMEKEDTILPGLATLSLQNLSLPPWWILF